MFIREAYGMIAKQLILKQTIFLSHGSKNFQVCKSTTKFVFIL